MIRAGQILEGPLFNEPMRVATAQPRSPDAWLVGLVGLRSEHFRSVNLTSADLTSLRILDAALTYDGDGKLLRLGLQAYALGIAYEFDPYFGLSISRVDPLPHQLAAVYDYLLNLPRVRFLLADDAGGGDERSPCSVRNDSKRRKPLSGKPNVSRALPVERGHEGAVVLTGDQRDDGADAGHRARGADGG